MTRSTDLEVAIVGAGPAGIGTAVALEKLDLEYAVLERDCIGASFRQWPDEMRLLTPSFPANAFGVRDLNAVTPDTSPALALDREHPTGDQYADYLEAVADFHDLPIETGVDVERVVHDDDGPFTLETDREPIDAQYVVWAAGQYQYPANGSMPGADRAVHVAEIDSWSTYVDSLSVPSSESSGSEATDDPGEPPTRTAADGAGAETRSSQEPIGDDAIVVGGAESGIDAALELAERGVSVTVLDEEGPWQFRSPDPSEVLSPRTTERLEAALTDGAPIDLVDGIRVQRIESVTDTTTDGSADPTDSYLPGRETEGYAVITTSGDRISSRSPPILATGFDTSLSLVADLFAFENGLPELTERDESTATPGLFLVGPEVAHNGQKFCFIYKFRRRFAIVAETIGERLAVDTDPLAEYREKEMYLEDLECCEPEYCDC
ncbi:NAD(P)/FAD-dependent oxidoreductase [Halobiforma nitratireducens]|nr:NAD(P)/FAD-dependent oxidoreductase [Halobiforma nitratireducens]